MNHVHDLKVNQIKCTRHLLLLCQYLFCHLPFFMVSKINIYFSKINGFQKLRNLVILCLEKMHSNKVNMNIQFTECGESTTMWTTNKLYERFEINGILWIQLNFVFWIWICIDKIFGIHGRVLVDPVTYVLTFLPSDRNSLLPIFRDLWNFRKMDSNHNIFIVIFLNLSMHCGLAFQYV